MEDNVQSAGDSVQRPKKRRRLRTQGIESGAQLAEGELFGIPEVATDTGSGDRPRKKKKKKPTEVPRSQDRADDSVRLSYQEDGTVLGDQQVERVERERTQKARKKKRLSQSFPLDELDKERQVQESLPVTGTPSRRQLPPAPTAFSETRDEETGSIPPQASTKKRQKQAKRASRRRSSVGPEPTEFVAGDYELSPQDIIAGGAGEVPAAQPTRSHPNSQPLARVFVEKKDGKGFVSQSRQVLKERDDNLQQEQELVIVDITTSDFALKSVTVFQWFAFMCHGLAAGFALWQCVVVYQLDAAATNDADFLSHYENTGQVTQSLYYLLLAVCCVSVLESYESAHAHSTCNVFRKFQLRPSYSVAIIIYVIGLVVSLAVAAIDYRIDIYDKRPDLWTDALNECSSTDGCTICMNDICYQPAGSSSRLSVWRALNTVRATCAVLGWLLVSSQASRTHAPDHLFPYQSDTPSRSQLAEV